MIRLVSVSRSGRLLILGMVYFALAPGLSAQVKPWKEPVRSAKAVQMHLEIRRGTFLTGDSINVRIRLRNTSANALTYTGGSAADLVRLRVLDADDVEVKRNLPPTFGILGTLGTLGPGEEITLLSKSGSEWINLRDWGYDLRSVGKYSIEGIPRLAGPRLTPDFAARSNKTTFAIKR